jgi:hypothetical protein
VRSVEEWFGRHGVVRFGKVSRGLVGCVMVRQAWSVKASPGEMWYVELRSVLVRQAWHGTIDCK